MFHKGLSRDIIVDAAKDLIENIGPGEFSMRRLADKLKVKTASLYTHVASMEALFTEIGLSVLKQQRECLLDAVNEKKGDVAVVALADSYRCFALEHAELYKLIMQMPSGNDEVLQEAAAMTAEPFMRVLSFYRIKEERKMHWQRVLRGMMHGFASEVEAGYFSHYPVSVEESYKTAVACVIDGLHKEEESENYGL